MTFKLGDRLKLKIKVDKKEIFATVEKVSGDKITVKLDSPLQNPSNKNQVWRGLHGTQKEAQEFFEVIEKSDWASLWDDSSDEI